MAIAEILWDLNSAAPRQQRRFSRLPIPSKELHHPVVQAQVERDPVAIQTSHLANQPGALVVIRECLQRILRAEEPGLPLLYSKSDFQGAGVLLQIPPLLVEG